MKSIKENLFTTDEFKLIGSRCRSCGNIQFPSNDFCSSCRETEMEEILFDPKGILHTYTVSRVPVGKFQPPHAVGVIKLDAGIKVTAPLSGEGPFEIGQRMIAKAEVLYEEEGEEILGYRFYPEDPVQTESFGNNAGSETGGLV